MADSGAQSGIEGRAAFALPRVRAEAWLVGAVGLCLLLQLYLAFTKAVHWDEFRFLADVHRHAHGELGEAVQTFHVHLFGWLLRLPTDEIGQIVAARLAMLAIEAGTVALIFRCARAFVPALPALFAALAYASFSFVMVHGASFRFDPPSIGLLMLAAALLLGRQSVAALSVAGLAVAVAGLITIKSVFMLPTLALIAAWRWRDADDRRGATVALATGAAAASIAFAGLFIWHQAGLAAGGLDAAADIAGHGARKTLAHGTLLPQSATLGRALLGNLATFAALVLGVAAAVRADGRLRRVALLGFGLPLLTLLFYRNAFPYYYAWVMAPAAVLSGAGAARFLTPARAPLIAILLLGGAVAAFVGARSPILAAQRTTLAAVHAIFPAPVAYIDRASMVPSFPKVGPFMSSWGLENYRATGRPIVADLLARHGPPLLIANSPTISAALGIRGRPPVRTLLPADALALRVNYVHHWGPLWVLGKRLELPADRPATFELPVAGRYTVEAAWPVVIDGVRHASGTVVDLAAGRHQAVAATRVRLTLRWGNRLVRPAAPPPAAPPFEEM